MPDPAATPAPDRPSAREEEVLRLIAWGYGTRAIAERLGVSTKTVETYKARAMGRLGLRTRAELVAHAIRAGWFAAEPPA